MPYAEVIVHVPIAHPGPPAREDEPSDFAWLDQTFTYEVPENLRDTVQPGQLVWVPFGSRRLEGLIVALADRTDLQTVRPLEEIVDERPVLGSAQLALARWLSHRYLAPLSECAWLLLPPGIQDKVEAYYELGPEPIVESGLNDRQRQVFERIRAESAHGRVPRPLRPAAESLVRQGYLVRRNRVRPALARPRRVEGVRLTAATAEIEATLVRVERRQPRREIFQLLQNVGGEAAFDELCEKAGCAPAVLHRMADDGLIEISGAHRLFALTDKYFDELPALAQTPARVLVFMREHNRQASIQAIEDATGAGAAVLRNLQEKGLIEPVDLQAQVKLRKAVAEPPGPAGSRLRSIIELLQRSPQPVWISAVYAETGATRADLDRLASLGVIRLETEEQIRDPLAGRDFEIAAPPTPTEEQAEALRRIQQGLESMTPCYYLLHGVTGSGKTEIYLRAIDLVLKQGRQALALVPEIALTPQTIQRFGERFGDRIGVIHSELSYGERYDTWRRARDGKLDVIIGPRSALFAPLPRLGLIVMDEEHEPSYKQEPDPWLHLPSYHARDVAFELARLHGASVILGSATPDVGTYWRTGVGQIELIELPRRILAHGAPGEPVRYQDLPPVQIVDLRRELREGNNKVFSRALAGAMRDALTAGEQVILFLNRRGYASSYVCRTCGEPVRCSRCRAPFTLHESAQSGAILVCHHCGKRQQPPRACPNCGGNKIRGMGLGTEQLERIVQSEFPAARTLRWDWDATRERDAHERILNSFARGEADILIGTQMIAKGLDLPRVTLVGVVNADTSLDLPDWHAAERTFQLLTQVAGRAGRSALAGKVIIQTYSPENYAVRAAGNHDYAAFYGQEIEFRRAAGYPPFRPLIRLLLANSPEQVARESADRLAGALQDRIRRQGLGDIDLIGPAPAFYAKTAGRYRYHLLLQGQDAHRLLSSFPLPRGWRIDVDPINLL